MDGFDRFNIVSLCKPSHHQHSFAPDPNRTNRTIMATTTLPWQSPLPLRTRLLHAPSLYRPHRATPIRAFRRSDIDGFARRMVSGELWGNAWRNANDGIEQLVFEAKKAAERLDRRYSVSRRLSSVALSAADRARYIDREFEIRLRWRTFTMDFNRNLPRYRKQLNDFLDTPLGRSFATIFFLWFAFSGWLFRLLIFTTWILPFAGPLLLGTIANNLVIKGACPACKRQFAGYKNQMIRCTSCGNVVWQPKGDDFFSRDGKGTTTSKSGPEIIDVEFEEK